MSIKVVVIININTFRIRGYKFQDYRSSMFSREDIFRSTDKLRNTYKWDKRFLTSYCAEETRESVNKQLRGKK